MRAPSELPRHVPITSRRARWAIGIAILVVIVLLILGHRIASFYTDLLWFRSVRLSSVWVKTITVEAGLGATFCVLFFGLLWGNLWLADRLAPGTAPAPPGDELVARWQQLAADHMKWIRLVVAI